MEAEWLKKVGIGLYLTLLACLFVGMIVIAFTNHTGGGFVVLGCFAGAFVGCVTAAVVYFFITDNIIKTVAIALLPLVVAMFFGSWVVDTPSDGFVTKEGSGSISLYESETFTVPYAVKIHYIKDFTANTEASLLLDGEGEVRWKAKVKLNLIADYDQVFTLLREFKGKVNWMAEIQQLFEREVNRYVAENFTAELAVIPRQFTFTLENQREEFSKLGFIPDGEVIVRETFRAVYKGG